MTVPHEGMADVPASKQHQSKWRIAADIRGDVGLRDRAVLNLVDFLTFLATLIAILLVSLDAHTPARSVLVLAVFGFSPGWVVCRLHPTMVVSERLPLAVAVSIALSAIVSAILLASHHWDPLRAFDVMAGVSSAGLATIMVGSNRSRRRRAQSRRRRAQERSE